MSEDEVELICETEIMEKHPGTILMTKNLKKCSLTQFFRKQHQPNF